MPILAPSGKVLWGLLIIYSQHHASNFLAIPLNFPHADPGLNHPLFRHFSTCFRSQSVRSFAPAALAILSQPHQQSSFRRRARSHVCSGLFRGAVHVEIVEQKYHIKHFLDQTWLIMEDL